VIIDFHVHIFPPQVKADRTPYLDRDPVFRSIYGKPRARIATAGELVDSMDRHGVDVSVVQGFGWRTPELCVEHNAYLMEACARYPGRLIPFCTFQSPLENLVLGGAKGIGELRPDEQGFGPDALAGIDPALPVLLHASEPVGHLYAGKGGMTPERLYSFITALPNRTVVLAHLGGGLPFYAAMPEVRLSLGHTYVDTAAWPLLYGSDVFPPLIHLFGAEKVLFASDFPLLDQGAEIERVRRLELPGEHGILGGNAARLLRLGRE